VPDAADLENPDGSRVNPGLQVRCPKCGPIGMLELRLSTTHSPQELHMKIVPTIGRVVLFHKNGQEGKDRGEQPCAAQVPTSTEKACTSTWVWLTPQGNSYGVQDVRLVQPDEVPVADPALHFCEWMQYQTKGGGGRVRHQGAGVARRADGPTINHLRSGS